MRIAQYVYTIPYALRLLHRTPSTFSFAGKAYTYFQHPYNRTWANERAVEIAIVKEKLGAYPPTDVLEVGNVLAHYIPVAHTVVDKYESAPHVITEDVVDLTLDRHFRCIISISTLEHVGWDERPRKVDKHRDTVKRLLGFLAPGGELIVTVPLGYNPALDRDIFEGVLANTSVHFFKRINSEEWSEASMEDVRHSRYGAHYRSTDGLAICVWRKPSSTGR